MPRALTLLTAVVAGLAAWTSLGALAALPAAPALHAAATQAGVLPHPFIAVLLVSAFAAWAARQPHARATVVIPALVLLPWLPIDLPAATRLWTGPMVGALWTAWLIALVIAARPRLPRRVAPWVLNPRRAMVTAFAIAAIAYVTGLALASRVVPGGDEPHYLIIARSLVDDGDLRIENNHARRDYLPYFEGELKPDYLRRGVDGAIYSIHAPGLPVLIAPALALFGHRGAMVFLALVSALGVSLAWRLAWEVTASAAAAWFGWAAVAFSAPFFVHAFAVYPDAPAGALVVIGLLAFVRIGATAEPSFRPVRQVQLGPFAAGAALAALPWLHTRYALLAAVLGAAVAGRLAWHRRWIDAGLFLATPLISAVGWFWFFQSIYGTPNPTAPYGGYTQSAAAFIVTGLTGLLVDQQFGLLATAPVLAFALVGIGLMCRARLWPLGLLLIAVCVPYALATSAYRMWWGGFSGPARFLVPLVPALVVPLAVLWARARHGATRAAALWILIWSVGLSWALLIEGSGRMAFTTRTPAAAWTQWLVTAADLSSGLPALFRGTPGAALWQAGLWAAAGLAAWGALLAIERRRGADVVQLTSVWAPLVLAVGAMAALTAAWRVEGAPPLRPLASQAVLAGQLTSATPLTVVGLVYEPAFGPFLTIAASRPASVIPQLRFANDGSPASPSVTFPLLPAGSYRLHLAGASQGESVEVSVGRSAPIAVFDAAVLAASGASLRLDAPVESLVIRRKTPFQPGDLVVACWGLTASPFGGHVRAARAARYGDFTVYFADDEAFPETPGFWVKGESETTIAVGRPEANRPIVLQLRNAPVANRVTVASGDWRESFDLAAGEERSVRLPRFGAGSGAVVVRIHARQGVRPSDIDPDNRDLRRLGIWVEMGQP